MRYKLGAAVLIAATLGSAGHVAGVHAEGSIPPPPRTHWMKTPCANDETSNNCFWNAKIQGNGRGHSYYVRVVPHSHGVVCIFYVWRPYAKNHDGCGKLI